MAEAEINISKEVFVRLSQGDEDAFREIFAHFTPLLMPGIVALVKDEQVAREIIQETFLQVWLKRAELGNMEQPAGWIFRVAGNFGKMHLRKAAAHIKWYESIKGENKTSDAGEDRLTVKELQRAIYKAIHELPPKRRAIFQLSREEGLSHDEIARRLNLSKITVMNQLSLALKFIQAYIKDTMNVFIPLFYISYIFFGY